MLSAFQSIPILPRRTEWEYTYEFIISHYKTLVKCFFFYYNKTMSGMEIELLILTIFTGAALRPFRI